MDELLRQVPLFEGLDDEQWVDLRKSVTYLEVARTQTLFHEGEPTDALYVVIDGKLKISRTSLDGRENLLAVLGSGDLLGELSLFDGFARTATATAVVDSRLARVAIDDFRAYLAERPAAAVELLRVLAQRLRAANDTMADLVFTDVPGRVARTLLSLAERFGTPTPGGTRVTHDLTQEELAQLVGASRETVNKALSEFANRGWLRLEGKAVVLLDHTRLEHRAR